MAVKDDLLKDLKSDLGLEEEIISNLSSFYQALSWKTVVDQKYHSDITNGLTVLKQDTAKHINIIKDMINYIEGSEQNEF